MRWLLIAAALAFVALIAYAFAAGDFGRAVSLALEEPWLTVAVADLYLGFLVFAVVILRQTRTRSGALAWCAALVLLGNPVAVLFALTRWRWLARA